MDGELLLEALNLKPFALEIQLALRKLYEVKIVNKNISWGKGGITEWRIQTRESCNRILHGDKIDQWTAKKCEFIRIYFKW